jgi:two-component system chemotaxis response regulator CheY
VHLPAKNSEELVRAAKFLVVDDEYYTRKVIRALLLSIGAIHIHDVCDGPNGLQAIATNAPDVVLLDWEMPGMIGPDFVRQVRSPDTFTYPNVPIIMLTAHGERSRVIEAVRLGVNEFLLKPVSGNALLARILSVLAKPRTMVRKGDYYGPEPRKLWTYKPEVDHTVSLPPRPAVPTQAPPPASAGATVESGERHGKIDVRLSNVLFLN